MMKCIRIKTSEKTIYSHIGNYASFVELDKKMDDIQIDKGNIPNNHSGNILNIREAINALNDNKYQNQRIHFTKDKTKNKNRQVTSDNYLEYNDQAEIVKKRIHKVLMSGRRITLTQIIDEYGDDIKLSRYAWTNHLKFVIKAINANLKHKIIKDGKYYLKLKRTRLGLFRDRLR